MDEDRFNKWVHTLRTTDKPQAKGHLCVEEGGVRSYCCLGIGAELAGVPETAVRHLGAPGKEGKALVYFGECGDLAPPGFLDWLDFDWSDPDTEVEVADGADIELDTGSLLMRPATPGAAGAGVGHFTAAGLNDIGLTFSQIADMLDYFGIVE